MRTFAFLLLGLFAQLATADELPWIGVSLNPSTSDERDKVSLNDGIGFLVGQVVAGGPLAKAGGREGDLWWKFDGQILVNKGQMVVLLRGKAPGEKVDVDFFREGELKKLTLVLKARPRPNILPVSMVEERPAGSRVLSKREQVARITLGDQELSLESEGERWRFQMKEEGAVVLSALVGDQDIGDKIPAKWHGAYSILRQTLKCSANPADKRARPGSGQADSSKSPVK